jgi:hypothetical protein
MRVRLAIWSLVNPEFASTSGHPENTTFRKTEMAITNRSLCQTEEDFRATGTIAAD